MRYFAGQCKSCGKWSAMQAKDNQSVKNLNFKCRYCNKGTKTKHKKEFGLHHRLSGPYNSKEIPLAVGKLNSK